MYSLTFLWLANISMLRKLTLKEIYKIESMKISQLSIVKQENAVSSIPHMRCKISNRELRDLVQHSGSLKQDPLDFTKYIPS